MSDSKRLRISEIRRNIFIIERYDFGNPGKWVELNMKGEEKHDVFTGSGLIVNRDESEYKDLKEAEEAMNDFIFYPRVVKEIGSTLTESITNILPRLEQCVFETNEILEKVINAFKIENGSRVETENDNLDNPI